MEGKLQTDIIKWLKLQGVYVIKPKSGPGTPVGCPDIFGLYLEKWLAIEVKASAKALFQPGQKQTLQTLKKGNEFIYVVTPESWPLVKELLMTSFF